MTAIALVQKVKDLPPVSHAALRLINLLDKPAVDNDEIVRVLTYDNVLTAKLLRACNSAAYGLEESVSSVDQAVFLLGHKQILHIVMTLAFSSVMTISSATYTMEMNELWEHSLVSAVAADIVRDQIPELGARTNVAFTASLLHDIGKLVMALALTKEQISEIRDCTERKQIPGMQAEREILGLDHGDVGAALLQSWRLPENIVEAVANHHRPVLEPGPRLSALVHLANGVAHYAKPPLGQKLYDLHIDNAVAGAFGIDGNKMEKMTEAVRKSFEQVDHFMEMA
jgi:putative nucleotidyltransferase with HDIG domain